MLTDILLIKKIKQEDDQKSFIELVNRHTGIYNTIAYSYTRAGDKSLYHDIIDDREYNFYSFIKDFDENKKMKFSTYVGERRFSQGTLNIFANYWLDEFNAVWDYF